MRSEGNVRHKLKQVSYRHLQRLLRENFRQKPQRCAHNSLVILDESSTVGLCGVLSVDGVPRHLPCDSRIPGCDDMAQGCSMFKPLKTKAEIKDEFQVLLSSSDRGEIASEYPDIAALLWVLDSEGISMDEVSDGEDLEDVPTEPHRWWSGIRKALGSS